jgi:hypothetical protein
VPGHEIDNGRTVQAKGAHINTGEPFASTEKLSSRTVFSSSAIECGVAHLGSAAIGSPPGSTAMPPNCIATRAAISLANAAATAGQRNAGFENRPPFVWYIVLTN